MLATRDRSQHRIDLNKIQRFSKIQIFIGSKKTLGNSELNPEFETVFYFFVSASLPLSTGTSLAAGTEMVVRTTRGPESGTFSSFCSWLEKTLVINSPHSLPLENIEWCQRNRSLSSVSCCFKLKVKVTFILAFLVNTQQYCHRSFSSDAFVSFHLIAHSCAIIL